MDYDKLAYENLSALPARLETDSNTALVGAWQGNLGIQVGAGSIQLLGQFNGAAVGVTQVNV